MITASGMYRALKCAGSDLLPHVEETTELTAEGHAVHGFLRALPEAMEHAVAAAWQCDRFSAATALALEEVPEAHRARCASLDLEPIRALLEPGGFHRETPLAWSPGRRITQPLSGPYRGGAGSSGAIYGTPDLFSVVDGCVVVADWKGRHPDGPAMVAQLELYAVMVADFLGLNRARCLAVAWGEDGSPRVIDHKDGRPWVLEAWDLDAVAEEAAALLERRNSLKPGEGLHAGPWCGHCPARHACHARGGRLAWAIALGRDREAMETGNVLARELVGGATDVEIFDLRDARLAVAKRLIEELEEEIRARAAKSPIRHPDGRVLGLKETLGPGSIDAQKALELARAEGHPEPEVESTVTKAAIEAAVGQTAPKRGKTKHVKAFLERLEARGGIKRVAKLTEWKEEPGAALPSAPGREAPPASVVAGGAPVLPESTNAPYGSTPDRGRAGPGLGVQLLHGAFPEDGACSEHSGKEASNGAHVATRPAESIPPSSDAVVDGPQRVADGPRPSEDTRHTASAGDQSPSSPADAPPPPPLDLFEALRASVRAKERADRIAACPAVRP